MKRCQVCFASQRYVGRFLIISWLAIWGAQTSSAQQKSATAGDLFRTYEAQIAAQNDVLAFKALEASDDLSRYSPLSSTALGIMYLLGRGVEVDSIKVVFAFGNSVYFDYINSDENIEKHAASMRRRGAKQAEIDDDVSYLRQHRDKGMVQYRQYMQLPEDKTRALQAFGFRWLACNDMIEVDKAVIQGDTEYKLTAAAEGLEMALMADSLAGDAFAEYLLGRMYYEGSLGMRDRQRGIQYLESSAGKSCISALTYLGEIKAERGDKAAAIKLWRRASQQSIYPIIPLMRSNIDYFVSPNLDLYDTQVMQLKALQYLK